jgi:hypothetical protein
LKAEIIPMLEMESNGMTFSQEVNIEAWTHPSIRAGECAIHYGKRAGTRKFKACADSLQVLAHAFAMRCRVPWRRRTR